MTTPTNGTGIHVDGNHVAMYDRNGSYIADARLFDNVAAASAIDDTTARVHAIGWAEAIGYTVSGFTHTARGMFAAVTYTGTIPDPEEPQGVDGATVDEQAAAAVARVPSATYVARALRRDAGITTTPAGGRRGYHVRGNGWGGTPVIDVDVSDAPRANNRAAADLEEALADLGWTVARPGDRDLIYVTAVPNARQAERRRINTVAAQRRAAAIAGQVQA